MASSGGNQQFTLNLGSETIFQGDVIPTLWWMMLSIGSCINVVLLLARLFHHDKGNIYERKMTYCSAAFVIACSVRSIWPRVDVERICFWDSWINVTFVGRALATVAEICFVAQFTMTIGVLAQEFNYQKTQKMANVFYWAICVAQCCCWLGISTQRQIWHGIEETIWALVFTGIGISFAVLYMAIRTRGHERKKGCAVGIFEGGDLGYAKRVLIFIIPGCVVYVYFMLTVDVPMYIARYQADQARGAVYKWVSEGILHSMSCERVSRSMVDWEAEMPWMTGYFLGATGVSLWLTWGPKLSVTGPTTFFDKVPSPATKDKVPSESKKSS